MDGINGSIEHLWTMDNSSKLKFVHWTSNHCPLYKPLVQCTCPLPKMDPMDKIHPIIIIIKLIHNNVK